MLNYSNLLFEVKLRRRKIREKHSPWKQRNWENLRKTNKTESTHEVERKCFCTICDIKFTFYDEIENKRVTGKALDINYDKLENLTLSEIEQNALPEKKMIKFYGPWTFFGSLYCLHDDNKTKISCALARYLIKVREC